MAPTTISPLTEQAFERIPVPGVVLDPRSRVVHANAAACAVLGLSGDELRGQDITTVIQCDDPTWCSTDPVDQLGTPAIGRELNARIGGKRRRLRVAVYPLLPDESEGRLIVVRDAVDEAEEDEAVREYKTTLEELCACVAHEIRNPLTGIRTTVQFVASKLESGDPRAVDLVEVLKEMDRIEEIIGDLLRFGRPAEFTKERTSLNALIGRVLDSMEAQLRDAEIEAQRNFSEELPEFCFSPDSFQQVLFNILRNAVEAMPEGGRLKITTTVRKFRSERPEEAEIFISDSGHGIPEDLLEEIFNPFFTTRHNGTGLGLPISLGIVRAHGGRMTARNRADGGVTFRISLPMQLEEEPKP